METKLTESKIQETLEKYFMSPSSAKYQMENLFIYNWESDYLYVTKAGYAYECEIKISKADFLNDFKNKGKKHQILEGTMISQKRPNYFYYAVPENLITVEEVPEYAGLIYVVEKFPYAKIVKKAPKIHSDIFDEDIFKLIDKFYYNYRNWRNTCLNIRKSEIEPLKKLIEETKNFDGVKYKYNVVEANKKIEELEFQLKEKENKIKNLESYRDYYSDICGEYANLITENNIKTHDDLHEIIYNKRKKYF